MLTKQDIVGATRKYNSLPSREKVAIDQKVERMVKEVEGHEAKKDRDIKGAIKDLSQEVAGYCNNVIVRGRIAVIGGLGEKKFKTCSICDEHDSVMSHMGDGSWYCRTHKTMWNLSKEEKQIERGAYVN